MEIKGIPQEIPDIPLRGSEERKDEESAVNEPVDSLEPRGFVDSIKHGVKKIIHTVDEWTSPKESTHGDFEEPSYFQAGSHGATAGFAIAGLKGAAAGVAASTIGIFVEKKTGSTMLGVVAGTVTSAAIGGALGSGAGPAGIVTGVITGSLLGAYQVLRGNASSAVRDAGGNAGILVGPFVPGPSKLATGIGSAIGTLFGKSKMTQAAISAGLSVAIGVGLCALGVSPIGIPAAIAINAIGGGLSPFFGPRFSQFFRNLSNKMGEGVDKIAQKLHITDKPMSDKQKNIAGSIPSSYLKEAIRSFILSDGSLAAIAVAGLSESIEQVDIFMHTKPAGTTEPSAEEASRTQREAEGSSRRAPEEA